MQKSKSKIGFGFARVDSTTRQRGGILVWVAIAIGLLVVVTAFAIDSGQLYTARADLQAAADAAALAGASGIPLGADEVRVRTMDFAAKNEANGGNVALDDGDIELGRWDVASRTFTVVDDADPSGKINAVRVTPKLGGDSGTPIRMVFPGAFGGTSSAQARAIAYYQPREIMLVLDLSTSMNDDSEIRSIAKLGRSEVEAGLEKIWTELGSPQYGNMRFQTVRINDSNTNRIKRTLGIDDVPYPYPRGSWDEYIDYVRNDWTIGNQGYRNRYGGLTLVNYWLYERPRELETPVLDRVSAQPITAVKDAVDVFVQYMKQEITDDRVGMAIYTYRDGTGYLEVPLTANLDLVSNRSRSVQPGEYLSNTNIGAGMQTARAQLTDRTRPGSFKLMVVLTDGQANQPRNSTFAKQFVRNEARAAKDAGIPIMTISLGTGADKDLMQQVADITGGRHFNVPGGDDVADYEDELKDVFKTIAEHRPLRLVK